MQDERLERDLGGAPYLGAGEGGVRPVRGAEACRQRAGTAGRWVGRRAFPAGETARSPALESFGGLCYSCSC